MNQGEGRRDRAGRWMYGLYGAAVATVVWTVLAPWQYGRSRLGRSCQGELRERLGWPSPAPAPSSGCVVVHAVSAGEMAAAAALVREIRERLPERRVVLTSMTSEGRAVAESLRRESHNVAMCALLPWDRAAAMRAWLGWLRPAAIVVVETEIWPNLFRACGELDIQLLVSSGRLYPGDVWRYRLAHPFFRHVLERVSWLGAQSDADAKAFQRIGVSAARIEVAGNLKYDVATDDRALATGWREALENGAPLVVAGSTHSPEEEWLLAMLPGLRAARPDTRLVIAPRHVRRAAALRRLATRAGLRSHPWSHGCAASAEWDVLVVDEMGWLPSLYRYADVAIAGGTFARHGGHNLLEAAARGKPVVVGPHVAHIRQDVEALAASEAIVWLREHEAIRERLALSLRNLLLDPAQCQRIGSRACEVVARRRGAARRCAEQLTWLVGRCVARSAAP